VFGALSVSWHRLPHGGLEPQASSCGPGGAVSPGDPVPMLTLTSCMPRSKSLDAEPHDRHSRQLISPWRAPVAHHAVSAVWIVPSDPGAFIVEPARLLTIKARAEQATRPGLAHRR
jgi:hypothetical protein